MPAFVDIHSHVVPAGDDGAATIEEGLELCRLAFEAGTEILFATPHAHAPWDQYPRTEGRDRLYAESLAEMRSEVAAWGLDLRRGWEVYPSEIDDPYLPVHLLHLVYMGLTQGQNFDLEALAADCASDGIYEFLLCAPVLKVAHGVGTPLNPLAVK